VKYSEEGALKWFVGRVRGGLTQFYIMQHLIIVISLILILDASWKIILLFEKK
jgi:hypothetical protein